MADNTRVNDLQDKLLKAMDILNAQALNSISFDKTITCKIENDKDKKDGKYEVNDGNRIFTAYSGDTRLRAGDTVYVTVPEGNFENQKMIIGKKTADNDKPFNFTQPFDTFFDMTGNVIIPDEIKEEDKELIANSIEDRNATIENCKTSTWLVGSKDTNGDIVMVDVSNKDLIKYTRLAVRADFRTWIKNAVRGEYGINIYLRTSKPKTVSAENNAIENSEQIIEQGDYEYNWNNSMMYGNTYNFETYYSQEIVLDLEKKDIGRVDGIAIEFYQKANFYDKFNEPIPSSEDGFKTYNDNNLYDRFDINGGIDNGYYQLEGNLLSPNIFIDNFYLSFGYDISTFTDDYVEIYTQNRDSYRRSTEVGNDYTKENQKEIKMRWVHLKDGRPTDMIAAANKTTIGSKLNYEVRWYQYQVGAPAADEYCGIYWKDAEHPIQLEWNKKIKEINDNTNLTEQEKEDQLKEANKKYIEGIFKYTFHPDVNKQQEKIKVITLYDSVPCRSKELIFENEEELPPSKEAQHIMTALTITTKDGSNGNYMIYGQDNSIKDTAYAKETRTLEAWFDVDGNGEINYDENAGEKIGDIENLTWIFPEDNSMIELINGDTTEELDEENNPIVSKSIVTKKLPEYKIKSYYSPSYSNNTIQCEYSLNGVVYTTEKEFTFGPAGTMGTDQTLVVDFVGDINAIDINNINLKHQLQVWLYDNQNKLVTDFQNATIEWSLYYQSDNKLTIIPNSEDKTKADLTFGEGFDINSLYIAKVKIGKIETYFPLPIKKGYSYIKGPTQVIYQSNGDPAYNREEYKLYNSEGKSVKWRIRLDREGYQYSPVATNSSKKEDLEAGLYYDQNYNWINPSEHTWDSKNSYYIRSETVVKQQCYKNSTNGTITQINNTSGFIAANTEKYWPSLDDSNKLYPLSIYVKDAPQYGVQAIDDSGNVVWTQPILVLQNQWPNGVVNAWDGESLKLDYETQTVLAAAISAGKKNSEDNTFSGVMMGDWGEQDVADELSQTGLYGFHHGAMSYAFKEDGTAFIGKSSMARINFDGNESTIYSAGYKDTATNPGGMMINLFNNGNPYISLKSPGDKNSASYSEMKLDTKAGGSTIYMKKGNGQDITITNSGNIPLQVGSNFKVYWNGDIEANGGSIGNWNILSSGALQSNDKKITLNTASDGSIVIGNLNSGKITIDASGNGSIVMSNNSYLTGGTIYASTLSSNNGDDGTIYLDGYLEVLNSGNTSNTFLGYIQANTGDWWSDRFSNGVGFGYGEVSSPNAVVKATSKNVGLSFVNGGWISIDANGIHFGTKNNLPSEQTGIYARFA